MDDLRDPAPEEEPDEETWEYEDYLKEEKTRKRRPKREGRTPLRGGRWPKRKRVS